MTIGGDGWPWWLLVGGDGCWHLVSDGVRKIKNQIYLNLINYQDRKSVVEGKSVDLGGRRIIKKKKMYRNWQRFFEKWLPSEGDLSR